MQTVTVQTSEELLEIWRETVDESFLRRYVNMRISEEAGNDFTDLGQEPNGLEKPEYLLAELLHKNQLCVNLSEMDDALSRSVMRGSG